MDSQWTKEESKIKKKKTREEREMCASPTHHPAPQAAPTGCLSALACLGDTCVTNLCGQSA